MSPRHALPLSMLACCCAAPFAAIAADAPGIAVEWDLRLRHEQVDDAGFGRDAAATTARLRAGLRLAPAAGWTVLLEGEGVAGAGNYNSGANGKTAFPTVLDPTGAELNQAWVGWKGAQGGFTVGRQRIALDNQRWVGAVGWRQNEQTFDALGAQWKPRADLSVHYYWLDRVHRVAGHKALNRLARERDLDSHLLNVAWKRDAQQLVGYAYLHRDQDVATASTSTYGLRWTGDRLQDGNGWGLTAEAAHQADYGNNPQAFSHGFWLLEPAYTVSGNTFKAGWEHLGGNGSHALQSPLATLHAFNGWADKFLVTPVNGLRDTYVSAQRGIELGGRKGKWEVAYHDFRADRGGSGYGRELDASFGVTLRPGFDVLAKLADYDSDGFARDTRKLWLQVEWSL